MSSERGAHCLSLTARSRTEKMANPKIMVVGGGLAGLSATIKIAEMGG